MSVGEEIMRLSGQRALRIFAGAGCSNHLHGGEAMTQPINRRAFVGALAASAFASACGVIKASPEKIAAPMTVAQFNARRRHVATPSGQIAFVEQGSGPAMLFLHGVPLNGFYWRNVIAGLQDMRRCIALDLMGLGHTRISPDQDVSFVAQARMVREFMDAIGLERIDLVASDSGGAVAQLFAVANPGRLRSLTLTNCDVHDNWPPASILPVIELARQGKLIERYERLLGDSQTRLGRLGTWYANPALQTDEVYRAYIEPLIASPETRANFHRYWTSFDNTQTVRIEAKLKELKVPTLIVWGQADVYFDGKWGRWLRDTIPGTVRLVEVPGAKLFFPEDQPDALLEPLRPFLASLA
jgi:pimeloyl-ACP methyl ester carboxylesterase